METKKIKELADILNSHGLTRLEYSDSSARILLEKSVNLSESCSHTTYVTHHDQEYEEPSKQPDLYLKDIRSPIVGVFYAAPSPDSPPFVSIGTEVKKGDVLCIIEAMKLMNEVVAEFDGVIADVCVKNGDLVDFGRILFTMS